MGEFVVSKVYQTTFRQSIDLSNVPSGVYLVSIANGNKTYFNKIIKSKRMEKLNILLIAALLFSCNKEIPVTHVSG